MTSRTRRRRCLIRSALLVLGALLQPLHAGSTPGLEVSLHGTDLLANIPFEGSVSQVGGTLYLSNPLDSPGLPAGSALAEGYADDSGTFWAAATTGLVPYVANCNVYWDEGYVKNADSDTVRADITGANIQLLYYGGMPGFAHRGRVEFYVWVGATEHRRHVAEITRLDSGDFVLSDQGDFMAQTSYSEDQFGATWTLDPIQVELDLSGIPVGDPFAVSYSVFVTVEGAGGETIASAFFRDPISMEGGITITADGPTPVPEPAGWLLACVGGLVLAAARRRGVGPVHQPLPGLD